MTVASNDTPAPMTDIHDIKPALAMASHWPWWIWLVIGLAIVALVALAWWLRKRRLSQSIPKATAKPALPPDVEAFQQLDRLAARSGADPKQFYFSLSAILRRYVERRYEFPAAEMTTEELLPQIERLKMAGTLAEEVKRFCRNSDPIKFADAASSQSDMSKDLAFVRQFVEQTTVAPQDHQNSETGNGVPNQEPAKLLPVQKPRLETSLETAPRHQTLNTKH